MTEARHYSEKLVTILEDLLEEEIYNLQTDPGEGCVDDAHKELVHCVDDASDYIREFVNKVKTLSLNL